jgi:hypothetical protein
VFKFILPNTKKVIKSSSQKIFNGLAEMGRAKLKETLFCGREGWIECSTVVSVVVVVGQSSFLKSWFGRNYKYVAEF